MFVILCADSQLDSNIELDSYGVPAVDAGGIKTNDGSAYHDIAQGDSGGGGRTGGHNINMAVGENKHL